jgi:type I restriction enzyme S subunit
MGNGDRLPDGWRYLTVDEIKANSPSSVAIGPFGSRMKSDRYVASGVPVIRGNNISNTRELKGSFVYVDEQTADELRSSAAYVDDLVFPHRGLIGEVAIVPSHPAQRYILSTSLMKLTCNRDLVDPSFVFYFFRSPAGRNELLKYASTVGTPGIGQPLSSLRAVRLPVPPLRKQQAIAAVLRTLDDKIEADRQAVALAQRLADACFTRWRENLREPASATFGELASVYGGSTPKTGVAEYWEGEYAWAVPRDITALSAPYLFDTERHITAAGLASIGNRLHPPGSIFMTSRATIGAFAVVQRPCAANQGFIVVRPKDVVYRWFLFQEMRSRVDEMLDLANGSTFLEISRGNFKNMSAVLPSLSDLQQLHDLLDPLHGWCAAVTGEADRLLSLRDAFLPLLLSGDLQVQEVEDLVGEAV